MEVIYTLKTYLFYYIAITPCNNDETKLRHRFLSKLIEMHGNFWQLACLRQMFY